jgi:hypothetical protein
VSTREPRSPAPGALYGHLQSDSGVDHRTLVLSPQRVRVLRTLWSRWGVALLLAAVGSWMYFAIQSFRVPSLTRRVEELEAEGVRIDTLQTRLLTLQQQYDQVQRMLGAAPAIPRKLPSDSVNTVKPPPRRSP